MLRFLNYIYFFFKEVEEDIEMARDVGVVFVLSTCVCARLCHTNGLSLFVGLGYVSAAVSIDTKRYKTV